MILSYVFVTSIFGLSIYIEDLIELGCVRLPEWTTVMDFYMWL